MSALSLMLLTEDSAQDAHGAVKALLIKMLKQIQPGLPTHRLSIDPPEDRVALMMHANRWRGRLDRTSPGRKQPGDDQAWRTFCNTVATELIQGHFVVVHIDADQTWSRRTESKALADWRRTVVEQVRVLIASKRPADQVAALMSRLLVLVPHYSIEAWTYQHTTEAERQCCGRHLHIIRAWTDDRGALDEVHQPKDHICLGNRHNRALAGPGYPADAVLSAGKSWAAAVENLRACSALVEALQSLTTARV